MKRNYLSVDEIKMIQPDIYKLVLSGDCSEISAPGQFVNIRIDGFYLRRPISICDYDNEHITLIFKTVGKGTECLAEVQKDDIMDVLMPLGNGFEINKAAGRVLLVGGGIGVPPLYGLAKRLVAVGITPQVVTGFADANDIILDEEFRQLDIEPVIATEDASAGIKGFVTDAMKTMEYDYVFTCGPEPMLKAVYGLTPDGQFSFEARMACGFGACMGCSCETLYGYKRICKDGPVLFKEEIKWPTQE